MQYLLLLLFRVLSVATDAARLHDDHHNIHERSESDRHVHSKNVSFSLSLFLSSAAIVGTGTGRRAA